MTLNPGRTVPKNQPPVDGTLPERLERGEVVYFASCPFEIPEGADREFLMAQRMGGGLHKNISYDPGDERVRGFYKRSETHAERLKSLLADFSRVATNWVKGLLPRYQDHLALDRVSLRPEEEATRRLRPTAREDLLHLDNFPSRPNHGARILRLFVNVHTSEPRVCVTSDTFAQLLARYGEQVGLPGDQRSGWLQRSLRALFQPSRSIYDDFMLRFHHFLKANDEFQERGFKRYWNFPAGSAWLMMTDMVSHATLRGRYALEHSYFVQSTGLAAPAEAPAALLERACGLPVCKRAA